MTRDFTQIVDDLDEDMVMAASFVALTDHLPCRALRGRAALLYAGKCPDSFVAVERMSEREIFSAIGTSNEIDGHYLSGGNSGKEEA